MGELRKDMLPDPSQTEPVVSEDPNPAPVEEVVDESQPEAPPEPAKPPKGYVPHEALLEERRIRKEEARLRKEAEAKLHSLSSSTPSDEVEDDEVVEEVEDDETLNQRVKRLEKENLFMRHPELSDKKDEFEEFLTENPEYPLESAAKVFKAEHGLYPAAPARPGLERGTGGPKTAPQSGFTPAQLKELRENHPRKYLEYIQTGRLKPNEVNW